MLRAYSGILLFLIAFQSNSFAQSEDVYNAFLTPIELKSNVNAVVRYEKKTVEILAYDKLVVNKKRVVTVFNKQGNRNVNALEYYDNNVDIKKIEAHIYNAAGKEIKKIKEREFIDVSAVSEISIYEDDRVKYLNYIPLKYPYTIEYTSEIIYNNTAFFPGWRPINNYYVGIQHSEYEIINSARVELKSRKENFKNYGIQELNEHHFLAENLEGVKYEAYTPELKNILPKYKVALRKFNMIGVEGVNNNWSDFGKWMYDQLILGTEAIPQTTITEVQQLTNGVEDKIERAKIIYKYMQDKTRYISIQVGIGGWKPMFANKVDQLGYGDCKGLTNYMKSLLEAVDVQSYYTVVYGGKSIRSLDKEFSSLEGNHVILCVPNNNENIFLECTSQTSPFGLIAGFTDDRDVLLVKPDGGEIVHTNIYETDDNVKKTNADVEIKENGYILADVSITTTGFQYNLHEGIHRESSRDQELYYKKYWGNINGLVLKNIEIENDRDAIIYKEKIKLSSENYTSKSGNRTIFQPNIFNKVSRVPPRYNERKFELKIERSFKDEDEFIISYPEGIRVEAMAKGKIIETKFGKYQFNIEALDGNKLKYTRTYTLNKGSYTKEDYKAFRDFMMSIVKYDKTKVVMIKV